VGDVDARAVEILVAHMRTDTSGCHCGGVPLGASYPEHVVALLRAAGLLRRDESAVVRSPIPYGLPHVDAEDGYVECDTGERIVNADGYEPPGSLVVRVALPVHRAESLGDALELLDETAEQWRSSEHIPSGWQDVRRAIAAVADELEQAELIKPIPDG
jgi:hypothetical protein